jgi:hypothetical protein
MCRRRCCDTSRSVAIHRARHSGVDIGPAVRSRASIAADLAAVGVNVVRDEQIDVAVIVDVGERATRPKQIRAHACTTAHLGECAVPIVVKELVGAGIGHEQIDPAVVVVVGRARTHPVTAMLDARRLRHVLEASATLVPIQAMSGTRGEGGVSRRAAIDEKHIQPAIVIEVEEQRAGSHGFRDVLLGTGAVYRVELEASLVRDVGECHGVALRLCREHVAAQRGRRADAREGSARQQGPSDDTH